MLLLRDESDIILSIINQCTDVSIVESILEVIGDTTAAIHKPMYTEAIRFYNDHNRFPDYAFFMKNFPDMQMGAEYTGKYSLDILTDFLLGLRQEVVNQKATDALIQKNYGEVIECCNSIIGSQKEILHYKSDDAVRDYDEMEKRGFSGIISGIEPIDDIIHGFTYGTMTVIAAPPSMFKTTLAQNIAYKALLGGSRVAFISLELQKKNIYFNMLSRHAFALGYRIPAERIHKALLSVKDENESPKYKLFVDIAEDFKRRKLDGRFFIVSPEDITSWEPPYITRLLEQIDDRIGGLDVVFLDYIQICRSFAKSSYSNQSTDFVNDLISHFSILSKSFKKRGLIVFILSQVNRESIKMMEKTEGDKGMSLSSFAEFHALERDSHYGMLLYASAISKSGNNFFLKVIKNRTGATHEMPVQIRIELPYGAIGVYKPDEGVSLAGMNEIAEKGPVDLNLADYDEERDRFIRTGEKEM